MMPTAASWMGSHTTLVSALALSPDGRRGLSGSHDGRVHLYDLESRRVERTFDHAAPIRAVSFAAGGERSVVFSDDKTIHVWDTAAFTRLDQIPVLGNREEYKPGVLGQKYPTAVTFAADGASVLVGSQDKIVYLLEVRHDARSRRFMGHAMPVFGVGFARNQEVVWSYGQSDAFRFWEAAGRKEIRRFGKDERIVHAAVSEDAGFAVTATPRKMRIWNGNTGRQLGSIPRRFWAAETANTLAFAPGSHKLVYGTWQGRIRIWDLDSRVRLRSWRAHDGPVAQLAISGNGLRMLSACGESHEVRCWDL